ncbi:MAG: PAS domain S-box protein, partial [Desulfobacterales bacterium]
SAEVFLTRNTATIQSVIDQYVEIEGVLYIAVDDIQGEIIAHTFVPRVPEAVRETLIAADKIGIEKTPPSQDEVLVMEQEDFLDVSVGILGGLAGRVHVGMDTQRINALIWGTIIRTQLITFIFFLVSITVSYFLIRRISGPIGQLSQYARKVAEHDFSARLDIYPKDEIGELADSMRAMSGELRTFFSELEAAVDRATHDLQDALSYQSAIVENLGDGLAVLDSHGELIRCNQALLNMFQYSFHELAGQHWEILFERDMHPQIKSLIASLQQPQPSSPAGAKMIEASGDQGRTFFAHRKDRSRFPIEMSLTHVLLKDQWNGIAIIRDITARHQMHESLKAVHADLERRVEERTAALVQSNEQLEREISERHLIEDRLAAEKELLTVTMRSIAEGVVTTDVGGRIVMMNRAAEEILEATQEKANGKAFGDVFAKVLQTQSGKISNPVDQVLQTGEVFTAGPDLILRTQDGGERHVMLSAAPILDQSQQLVGTVMVLGDQTARVKLQTQMRKADKLESVGLLAGGIAHDFNNIISVVMGNIELARFEKTPPQESQQLLDHALKAARRARDLTQQLLTFSRGGAPVKKVTSVEELIKESALFALRGANVQCQFDLPDSLWAVEIDAGQISQVINNLVINAIQAMPGGGVLKVTTENITIAAGEEPFLAPGRYIKIAISDQGQGIADEMRHKIIDPYFSTKPGGSGLGLAVAYSVIRQHGGHIDFESLPGKGSTFYFYLQASEQKPSPGDKTVSNASTGQGKLLIMDDEEMILQVASGMLERLGYETHCTQTGQEAIDLYRQAYEQGAPFDAVIMDLTVPGHMGGKEAIQHLKAFDPRVKAIVSSGYSNDPVMAHYRDYDFCGIIAKPFSLEDLSTVVHEVLANGAQRVP